MVAFNLQWQRPALSAYCVQEESLAISLELPAREAGVALMSTTHQAPAPGAGVAVRGERRTDDGGAGDLDLPGWHYGAPCVPLVLGSWSDPRNPRPLCHQPQRNCDGGHILDLCYPTQQPLATGGWWGLHVAKTHLKEQILKHSSFFCVLFCFVF